MGEEEKGTCSGYSTDNSCKEAYGCKDKKCERLRERWQREQLEYDRPLRHKEAAEIQARHNKELEALRSELKRANHLLDVALLAMGKG